MIAVHQVLRAQVAGILLAADRYSIQPQTQEGAYDGCMFWLASEDGLPVFAWAARVFGDELVIVAAAATARARGNWTAQGFNLIEANMPAGCVSVAFQTERGGLVEKSAASGYEVAGYIVRKRIK